MSYTKLRHGAARGRRIARGIPILPLVTTRRSTQAAPEAILQPLAVAGLSTIHL
jgi:hypothetical protein